MSHGSGAYCSDSSTNTPIAESHSARVRATGGATTAAYGDHPIAASADATATAEMEKQFQHQQLKMRSLDDIETLSEGEDQWQSRRWTVKTAVSGTDGELAAEADGVRNLEEILKEDAFVDANKENASRRADSCTMCERGARALKRQRS